MNVAQSDYFAQLLEFQSDPEAAGAKLRLGEVLQSGGFTPMRRFLDDFRGFLRAFDDGQVVQAFELLRLGRTAVPEPGRISPSWSRIWEEYETIIRAKRHLFQCIPVSERIGEWQVLLDNPYSSQHIAVYPGLTFMEAAYMFAYFRTDLTNNEYIRLQKVETVIAFSGADKEGLEA